MSEVETVQVPLSTPPVSHAASQHKHATESVSQNPSRLPIYIYSLVILLALVLGVSTTFYWFTRSTQTQEVTAIQIPSLINSNLQTAVPLLPDKEAVFSKILDASINSGDIVQIYPTVTDTNGTSIPAGAQTILSVLNLRMPGSFTRSIRDITFGSANGSEVFIIMRTTDFDTAFAGMLQWEAVMSADLSPLFGLPVSQSYDPYARTSAQIRPAFFRDEIIANKSARVLVDENNEERIVYAFVQPTILVITTNTDTLNTLIPLLTP